MHQEKIDMLIRHKLSFPNQHTKFNYYFYTNQSYNFRIVSAAASLNQEQCLLSSSKTAF